MAYQQSPGVEIIEKDASAITVGLSTTIGATVGAFRWGPVENPMLISDEGNMVSTFGTPDQTTFPYFFAATNFLAYTNACWVNRVVGTGALNATVNGAGFLIKNFAAYEDNSTTITTSGPFAARYAGELGSGLIVSIADSATYSTWEYASLFSEAPGTSEYALKNGSLNDELHMVVIDGNGKFSGTKGEVLEKYDFVSKASDAISYQGTNNYYAQVLTNQSEYVYWLTHPTTGTNWGTASAITPTFSSLVNTKVDFAAGAVLTGAVVSNVATLTFAAAASAPYTLGQEITISGFTGLDAAIYNGTNKVVTACTTTSVSYKVSAANGSATTAATATILSGYDFKYVLTGGNDGIAVVEADMQNGWDFFLDTQTYDVSLLIAGAASISLSQYVVQKIADTRRDCVAFTSITKSTSIPASPILGTDTNRLADAKAFKTFDSTFAVIDSGFKYMYDKYNDKYRWVALNADTAGLCARVDATNDPWFSPAGMSKGQVKDVVKLAWNPSKTERDYLYPAAINPVINQVGQGTILFGDRTATTKPSAFDKINVRRMFLVLEKSIANSAKYQLFELNDEITRLQFVASIEPFLRDVKGRHGIEDYQVICSEQNNTPQVIASNNFVGTILVRPKYSISYVTLNFVATGPNVSFELAATI